jgi:multiple antibiotic resistance protein
MRAFILCFVPLFVAVDAVGVLPIYIGLTEDVAPARRRRVVMQSIVTATAVGVVFLLAGGRLLESLGITVADFMVAGGLLLVVLALSDILQGEKTQRRVDPDTLGAVPIGVPLITGPAVLTTSLLLASQHGVAPTALALVINILIAGAVFRFAEPITRTLGSPGTRTLSKIASLLLAAIAVMIIRKGVVAIIQMSATAP